MIKAIAVFALVAMTVTGATAQSVQVRGHTTRNGTYVPPHVRTAPNSTRTDNWSSTPNTNPYNGKAGTVDPYAPKPYKPYGSR